MTGWSNGGWEDGYIPDGAELAMAAEGQWPYESGLKEESEAWAAQDEMRTELEYGEAVRFNEAHGLDFLTAPQPDGSWVATVIFYGVRYAAVGDVMEVAYLNLHNKVWNQGEGESE